MHARAHSVTLPWFILLLAATIVVRKTRSEKIPFGSKETATPATMDIGNRLRLKECKHGSFLINRLDTYVGRSLDYYGEWSEEELVLFLGFVKDGDLVIDVGANIGAFVVPLAKRVGPDGAVVAFEPQRVLSQLLAANVALNEIENVQVHHAGVGREKGTLDVPRLNHDGENNFGAVTLLADWKGLGTDVERVPQISLDDMFYVDGGTCPSFIKIDVEGMEADVLSGAHKLVEACKPVLHVENNCVKDSPKLITLIYSLNYTCHWDIHSYNNWDNFFGQTQLIFPDNVYSINMLCLPRDDSRLDGMRNATKIDSVGGRLLLQDYNVSLPERPEVMLRQLGTEEHCQR